MLKTIGTLVAVLIVVVMVLRVARPRSPEVSPGPGQDEGGAASVEDRPEIRIDPDNVPADLRDLIPIAEEWGIGDDVIRGDYGERASDAQKQRFKAALTGRTARVTEWLDSFGADAMSEEAGAFMYMLEALDEMGLWPD